MKVTHADEENVPEGVPVVVTVREIAEVAVYDAL